MNPFNKIITVMNKIHINLSSILTFWSTMCRDLFCWSLDHVWCTDPEVGVSRGGVSSSIALDQMVVLVSEVICCAPSLFSALSVFFFLCVFLFCFCFCFVLFCLFCLFCFCFVFCFLLFCFIFLSVWILLSNWESVLLRIVIFWIQSLFQDGKLKH